jgi:hypothetical protein
MAAESAASEPAGVKWGRSVLLSRCQDEARIREANPEALDIIKRISRETKCWAKGKVKYIV